MKEKFEIVNLKQIRKYLICEICGERMYCSMIETNTRTTGYCGKNPIELEIAPPTRTYTCSHGHEIRSQVNYPKDEWVEV